ncbi:MAG: bactofilin family protein [Bacteroidia bacterium]
MAIFNQSKNSNFNPQEINILNAGTKIQGDLVSEGDLRIDGGLRGNIEVKAKLVLGVSSQVDGNIKAVNCDISGVVNGNVEVNELLTIKASAKIKGDIACGKLIIESGAIFNGKSSMSTDIAASMGDYKNGKLAKPIETKAPVLSGEKAAI